MPRIARQDILNRFRSTIACGGPIVGDGAGPEQTGMGNAPEAEMNRRARAVDGRAPRRSHRCRDRAHAPGLRTEQQLGKDCQFGQFGGDHAVPRRPLATPEHAQHILNHCPGCHGFYGASSMERLPTEPAVIGQTRKFKRISR